jgi:hypothetical protein
VEVCGGPEALTPTLSPNGERGPDRLRTLSRFRERAG